MGDPYSICVLRSSGTYSLLAYRCFLGKSGSNSNLTNHIYCFFFHFIRIFHVQWASTTLYWFLRVEMNTRKMFRLTYYQHCLYVCHCCYLINFFNRFSYLFVLIIIFIAHNLNNGFFLITKVLNTIRYLLSLNRFNLYTHDGY